MNWLLYFEFLAKIGRGLARVGSVIFKIVTSIMVPLFFSAVSFMALAIVAHLLGFNIQLLNVQIVIGVISVPIGFCFTYLQMRSDLKASTRDDDDRSMSM